MKYIDFAENERLSTIVLGMMRISELSEDEGLCPAIAA